MAHGGKANFDDFVPQKNNRRKKIPAENKIPDIIFQAESIVNTFISQKTNSKKTKKSRRSFPILAAAILLLAALFVSVRII